MGVPGTDANQAGGGEVVLEGRCGEE